MTEKKNDIDELKQLLNLEPPKINLNMFDSLKLSGAQKPAKMKKLSVKQRKFKELLQNKHINMQRDQNPQDVVQKHDVSSSLSTSNLKLLSRGQKKRLERKA